jgi:ABC-type lipoprotein export system ATPase subunit
MANNPTVLLADEPTAALDSERGKIVMSLLRKLSRERSPRHTFIVFGLFAGQSGSTL